MYEYADGKVDWMAAGLPVEGAMAPFVESALADVTTCGPHDAPGEVADRLQESGAKAAVVLNDDRVVVGFVTLDHLQSAEGDATVLDVMDLSPRTIRPSVALAELDPDDFGTLVTTAEGVLLGAVDPGAVRAALPEEQASD